MPKSPVKTDTIVFSQVAKSFATNMGKAVSAVFDRLRTRLMGNPIGAGKKIVFSPKYTLEGLYRAAAGIDYDKILLQHLKQVTESYLDAEEARAKASIAHTVQSWLSTNPDTNAETVLGGELAAIMGKAISNVHRIVGTELNNAKNFGTLDYITRISSAIGVEDPVVYWICIHDRKLCLSQEESVKTPSGVVKLAEVKPGDILSSLSGDTQVKWTEKKKATVVDLVFDDGRKLTCTEDHPILTKMKHGYLFIPASAIHEKTEIVDTTNLSPKQRAAITTSLRPRAFMEGYQDTWNYWLQNGERLKDLVTKVGVKKAARQEGIPLRTFQTYGIEALKCLFPNWKIVGGFRKGNGVRKRHLQKTLWQDTFEKIAKYERFGGREWLTAEVKAGGTLKDLSKRLGISSKWLRLHLDPLDFSSIKARGGRKNWEENRPLLLQRSIGRRSGFKSKPEKALASLLEKAEIPFQQSKHLLGRITVDFLVSDKLVVEFDGSGHDLRDRLGGKPVTKKKDFLRDRALKEAGFRVFRIKSPKDAVPEVLVEKIKQALESNRSFTICHV